MTIQQSRPSSSNGLGIAGFIVSLVGLCFTGGTLCPVGLILSLIALMKPPRGFAIAGTVLGFIGTMIPVFIFVVYGVAALSFCACISAAGKFAAIESKTQAAMQSADTQIASYYASNHALPDDSTGNAQIARFTDGYGHHLRYTRRAADQFEIRSAGQDGLFDTPDDRVRIYNQTGDTLPAPTGVMPSTAPALER